MAHEEVAGTAAATTHEFSVERMDLHSTARVLGAMTGYLEAEEAVRQAQGMTQESPLLAQVRAERNRLINIIRTSAPGEREAFLDEHKPRLDMLDGIYDCGSDNCPRAGYNSPDEREMHHRMWGFDNPLIDVRTKDEK